ncbi:MAG: hypothetical protein AAF004_09220 [Pseudomonadota bacterium]
MLSLLAAGTFFGWLVCAAVAFRAAFLMAEYDKNSALRVAASRRLRACDSILLLIQSIGVVMILVTLNVVEPVITNVPLATKISVLGVLVAYALLILITWLMPDLPGRGMLRRIENVAVAVMTVALLLFAAYGVFVVDQPASLPGFIALAVVAITFMLFVLSRRSVRGAITVVQHLDMHGSHPRREATLKRLLGRWYQLLGCSAAVWVTAALVLLY